MKKSLLIITVIFLIILSACSHKDAVKFNSSDDPYVLKEFRAAWIATVANINWPSEPGLSVEKQKEEAVDLLDLLKEHNYNAVIFQVRPQCDALYKSELEPWSYYLTGKQGEAPDPFYDPLNFWLEEAHKRGLELHVWLNPYRAHHKDGKEISKKSIVNKYPEICLELSSGYWWLDPSSKKTQDHSYSVVMDIVNRYDIDGVHFDDYFYPYPSYHKGDFPDSTTWNKYKKNGGELSRGDWRRDNVNKFVKRVYDGIKSKKPYVKFGLSPFGIWRPNNPPSIKGFDQYEKLYADAKLWLNEGWIDYWTPQLYWRINKIDQSFPVLLRWWEDQNHKERYVWPGLSIAYGADETVNQIMVTRGITPEAPGNIHWSIAPLVSDSLLRKELKRTAYRDQALIPPLHWIKKNNPLKPDVKMEKMESEIKLIIRGNEEEAIKDLIISTKYGSGWSYKIYPSKNKEVIIPSFLVNKYLLKKYKDGKNIDKNDLVNKLNVIRVSITDRYGNESKYVELFPNVDEKTLPVFD